MKRFFSEISEVFIIDTYVSFWELVLSRWKKELFPALSPPDPHFSSRESIHDFGIVVLWKIPNSVRRRDAHWLHSTFPCRPASSRAVCLRVHCLGPLVSLRKVLSVHMQARFSLLCLAWEQTRSSRVKHGPVVLLSLVIRGSSPAVVRVNRSTERAGGITRNWNFWIHQG